MSVKAKGINAERELIHLFWANSWSAVRVAGSGSNKYPSPDIIASNALRRLAIEAKITKEKYKHFLREEVEQLKEFSKKFGAEPWIAIKFKGNDWFFICPEDLQHTDANFSISLEAAKRRGIAFNELISFI